MGARPLSPLSVPLRHVLFELEAALAEVRRGFCSFPHRVSADPRDELDDDRSGVGTLRRLPPPAQAMDGVHMFCQCVPLVRQHLLADGDGATADVLLVRLGNSNEPEVPSARVCLQLIHPFDGLLDRLLPLGDPLLSVGHLRAHSLQLNSGALQLFLQVNNFTVNRVASEVYQFLYLFKLFEHVRAKQVLSTASQAFFFIVGDLDGVTGSGGNSSMQPAPSA